VFAAGEENENGPHAHRLAALLPDARVEEVEDSLTFVPEDQPERLADAIARFVRETAYPPAAAPAGAGSQASG